MWGGGTNRVIKVSEVTVAMVDLEGEGSSSPWPIWE